MSNIQELINMFENALKSKSDIILDPYDYGLIMKILEVSDAIRFYNSLASLFPEAVEDNVAEPHEIILTYDRILYSKILKRLRDLA